MGGADNCDFCKIARHQLPARIVWESETMLAFLPRHPASRGHTLVIPKDHIVDFLALTPTVGADLAAAVVHLGRAVHRAVDPEGMNAITSSGGAATQTVFHLHVHLVPRWRNDRIGDIWPKAKGADEADDDAIAAAIRAQAADPNI